VRSFAAVFDRLVGSSTVALPWPAPRARARVASRPSRRARGRARPLTTSHLSAIALLGSSAATFLSQHARIRSSVLALLVAAPLAFGGWLWLRTSSFVAVDHVYVSGVSGPDARAIERALETAGRRMTTLDVNRHALLAAVARFHLVRSLRVSTSFPHGMQIHVVEELPVATLVAQGAQTALAADGSVLGPELASAGLPTLSGTFDPPTGGVVHDGSLRASLTILGAAPARLVRWIKSAFAGPRGVTVSMRNGLDVYFGDATRPHAKWLALALVLEDTSSAHASAIDVRVPERPAALLPTGSQPSAAGEASQLAGASTNESLAAALAASAGFGSSAEAQGASAAKAAQAASGASASAPSSSGAASGSSAEPGSQSGAEPGSPSATESGSQSGAATGSGGGSEAGSRAGTEAAPAATAERGGGAAPQGAVAGPGPGG